MNFPEAPKWNDSFLKQQEAKEEEQARILQKTRYFGKGEHVIVSGVSFQHAVEKEDPKTKAFWDNFTEKQRIKKLPKRRD